MERSTFLSALESTARIACCATLINGLLSCERTEKEEDPLVEADADGDGFSVDDGDCDDGNANVFPNAPEVCNGIDDDCDNQVDNNPTDGQIWYTDADSDGFGVAEGDVFCTQPAGTSDISGDCDDSDATLTNADADGDGYSTCDGDCNDNDASDMVDADGDGYSICAGDCDDTYDQDMFDYDEDGYTMCDGDCNDWDANYTPIDGDGDGLSSCDGDCDDSDPALNMTDADGDGYSTCQYDCDDQDPSILPAEECYDDCQSEIDAHFSSGTGNDNDILECCMLTVDTLGFSGWEGYEHWDDCCNVLYQNDIWDTACSPWGPPVPPAMKNELLQSSVA